MKIYMIWDRRTNDFWGSSPAKKIWTRPGSAKTAVVQAHCWSYKEDKELFKEISKSELNPEWLAERLQHGPYKCRNLSFNDQYRFECREYDLSGSEFKVV